MYLNPRGKPAYLFIRDDANQDFSVDIANVIFLMQYLFGHGDPLPCADAGDANDDEKLNIAEAIYILNYLFGGGTQHLRLIPVGRILKVRH